MKTIKSVYKIGNGPSSSHTVGPFHAATIFGKRWPDADHFRVTLFGLPELPRTRELSESTCVA